MVEIMDKLPDPSAKKDPHAEQDAKINSALGKIGHKFLVMSGKAAWEKPVPPSTFQSLWRTKASRSGSWMSIFTDPMFRACSA